METGEPGEDDDRYTEASEEADVSQSDYPVRTIDAANRDEVEELEQEWREAYAAARQATRPRRMAAWLASRSYLR